MSQVKTELLFEVENRFWRATLMHYRPIYYKQQLCL